MYKNFFQYIFLSFSIILFLFSFFYSFSFANQDLGNNKKLGGYAWSSNIGWISLNCSNTNSCDDSNYGVYVNESGQIKGYGWSSNIGWLSFEEDGFSASYNSSTKKLSGTAKFISADDKGWDGKISLSGANYGVEVGTEKNRLEGYAWGSDVVGWISFNWSDELDLTEEEEELLLPFLEPFKFIFSADKGTSEDNKLDHEGNLVLTWQTYGADSCIASNNQSLDSWNGNKGTGENPPANGSETISDLTQDTTFYLECQDSAGAKIKRSIKIFVKSPAPAVTLTADDYNISSGEEVTLSWTGENISSCILDGTNYPGDEDSIKKTLTSTKYFEISCIASDEAEYPNGVKDSITINVEKMSVEMNAKKNPVAFGETIVLQGEVEFADSCTTSGGTTEWIEKGKSWIKTNNNFEIEITDAAEGSQPSFTLTCKKGDETISRTVDFRVRKNPIFTEN